MKTRMIQLAVIVMALTGSLLAKAAEPHFDFSGLEKMAVQEGGRKKPYSSLSYRVLETLKGSSSYDLSKQNGGGELSAMQTVMSIWLQPEQWISRPLILVGYLPLRKEVGLTPDQKCFSYATLIANAKLQAAISDTQRFQQTHPGEKMSRLQHEALSVAGRLALFEKLAKGSLMAIVPNPQNASAGWLTLEQAGTDYPAKKMASVKTAFAAMMTAFSKGDTAAFLQSSKRLTSSLAKLDPAHYPPEWKLGLETFYIQLHPFRWAWVLYALAAIALWLTTLRARKAGYWIAWAIIIGGFLMQLFGFTARVLIADRAPVTNMYESIIWVAFGAMLFAMILEAIYRCRYYFLGATPLAVVLLMLADTQSTIFSSAIEPLRPVLRDNFWLSTHVTSITLSYAAFLLSLGVGHIILFKTLFRKKTAPELYTYLYRSLQIGVLLLAIGTILGGIWANYSWGRFWSWDPKETWALIALLSYIFLLHGRIAGWWSGFGLAVGSVIAFLSVLMAWYGVNFVLGTGLHSYGFGTGGLPYVVGYVVLELLFTLTVIVVRTMRKAKRPSTKSAEESAEAV